jgi:hypothetical protein
VSAVFEIVNGKRVVQVESADLIDEHIAAAAAQAGLAAAWATGTAPGGPGTQSAREFAENGTSEYQRIRLTRMIDSAARAAIGG